LSQTRFLELKKAKYPKELVSTDSARFGDANKDGILDLFVSKGSLGTPNRVFLNDGTGKFVLAPKGHMPSHTIDKQSGLALGDVDGDGDLDAIFSSTESCGRTRKANARLYLNNGKGFFVEATKTNLPSPSWLCYPDYIEVGLVDVDGDKDLDLVSLVRFPFYLLKGYGVLLYLNNGKGVFTDATQTHMPKLSNGNEKLSFADLDGDGDTDIVIGPFTNGPWVLMNNGKGYFTEETNKRISTRPTLRSFAVSSGDLDGDGDIDIVLGSSYFQGTLVYFNNGKGFFKLDSKKRIPKTGYQTIDTTLADVDNDGDLDIFLSNPDVRSQGSQNALFINDGKGNFTDQTKKFLPSLPKDGTMNADFGDIDRDGDLDLVLACQAGNQNHVYFNTWRQIYPPKPALVGKPYPLDVYGNPGDLFLLYGGLSTRWTLVQPFGYLGINPQSLFLLPGIHLLPSSRKLSIPLAIPNIPGLKGQTLHLQGLYLNSRAQKGNHFSNLFRDLIQ